MKILTSITYYTPHISGLTIYAQRLAEGLVKKGHQVTILTSKYSSDLPAQETINGVKLQRSFILLRLSKGVIMPLFPLEALWLTRKVDVINCHLPQPEAFCLLLFGRIFGKKTIATYHCDVRLPKKSGNRFIEKLLFLSNFSNCLLAEKVVNSSLDYAQNSLVLRFFSNKIKIIYPAIKNFSQTQEDNIFKKKIGNGKKNKIGFVGRLAADKGVEYLLEAITFLEKKLDKFSVFLVGPQEPIGEKSYQKKINHLIQKYQKKVFLLGELTEKQLATFLKSIDVLVLPSVNSTEAFGMIQAEAMLCNKPIVATNLPGVRIPVHLTKMGEIVPPHDPQKIAEAIIKIINNKNQYLKGKKMAIKYFSLKKTLAEYETIYSDA